MKRILLVCLVILLSHSVVSAVAEAENFPGGPPASVEPQRIAPPPDQQRMFYGYVPPAPIRHTWPGGYRVIFNELTNTLIEHILGQY